MNDLDGLDVSLLEPILRDFVRLVGLRDTMAIVARHGGRQLYIPEDGGCLTELIGPVKAAIIGRAYRTERPLIPKAKRALRHLRDRHLQRLAAEQQSVRKAAVQLGISERRAWQIRRGEQRDDAAAAEQLTRDLFE